jgi:hypothetical protein
MIRTRTTCAPEPTTCSYQYEHNWTFQNLHLLYNTIIPLLVQVLVVSVYRTSYLCIHCLFFMFVLCVNHKRPVIHEFNRYLLTYYGNLYAALAMRISIISDTKE